MSDDTRPAAAWAGAHAFRAVAARLGDPAPGLLTAVSLSDAVVSSLMPALPLVDFSPFDELPGAPLGAEGRPASTTGRAAGQASPPPAGEGVRPIRREPPAATSPQGGASAPPVFSLRRSGRSLRLTMLLSSHSR